MLFMLLHVLINPEDLFNATFCFTRMNEIFLYWLLNVVTSTFRVSRGGRLFLYGNSKEYEVADYIATKVEVIPRIISILINVKSI